MVAANYSARRDGRHGLTIIECLVVTAIIGVVVALLLPAIQAARKGHSNETDEALLAKLNPGLQAGSFRHQPQAVTAVLVLLRRGHAKAKEPEVIDCLIATGALLLTDNAQWTDRNEAREVYDLIKRYDANTVVDGLVRKVIHDNANRLHVLFLGVKLGIPGSQETSEQSS